MTNKEVATPLRHEGIVRRYCGRHGDEGELLQVITGQRRPPPRLSAARSCRTPTVKGIASATGGVLTAGRGRR